MPDESVLRAQVRQLLHMNRLPRRPPDRTWGGPGVGVPCAVCEQPVSKSDFEMEIQFAYDGADRRLDKFHLHLRWFAAWELERTTDGQTGA